MRSEWPCVCASTKGSCVCADAKAGQGWGEDTVRAYLDGLSL